MTFNSWEFLIFYPVVLLLWFTLPKVCRRPMLLVASYFFYMCYQAELVFLIFATTLISWGASFLIEKSENKKVRRAALAVTLIVCLGVLFFYKYFNFFAETACGLVTLFGGKADPIVLNLILPVGISFYTFQTLSYVIDVYRGDIRTEKNFFWYALYVSFFPQLVAGPIERPENLLPQLKEDHRWNRDDAVKGAKHMLLGFFKKVVVADTISVYVDAVYNHPSGATGLGVLLATLLFAVQIYCDFSGYTDIAIGCARVMGIRLMKNFDHPYTATSIREFWARWHISLSTWFRDYLYIPLGGSRCKKWRHMCNLFLVFLVSGLWHGANLTYVVWGAVHGLYQVTGALTRPLRSRLLSRAGISEDSVGVRSVRRFFTFLLVSFAWIFFRAGSIADAGALIAALFTGWSVAPAAVFSGMGLTLVRALTVLLSILLLVLLDRLLTHGDEADGSLLYVRRGGYAYLVWIVAFAWALLLSKGMESTFIYFQF